MGLNPYEARRVHALNRLYERFGIQADMLAYTCLNDHIKMGKAKAVKRLSKSRSIFELEIKGTTVYPIYSRKGQQIVSFLTKSMVERKDAVKTIKPEGVKIKIIPQNNPQKLAPSDKKLGEADAIAYFEKHGEISLLGKTSASQDFKTSYKEFKTKNYRAGWNAFAETKKMKKVLDK